MIKGQHNYIYRLKADQKLGQIDLKAGQEFNIVNNVLYMEGHPVHQGVQEHMLNWVKNNEKLFVVLNREY